MNLRNNHHVLIYRDESHDFKEEVVSFWKVIKRKKSGAPLYQLPNEDCELVTTLHISDMFLLDVHDLEQPIEEQPRDFIMNHLYRIQKLSSGFYEFRHAYNNQLNATEYPHYIRINNYGSKKTGWLTHNPVKVEISPIGEITYAQEKYLSKTQKLIL